MRQQFPMQTKRLGNAVYRCSRDWLGKIITLAYTGSSPLMQTSSRASAPLGQPSTTLDRENPPPFSHSICFGKAARKQAWPSARAPHRAPTASRCARLQLQRCAVKSTARAAAAYIYLLYRGGSPAKPNR